jgi:hypothetical protein
MVLPLSNLLCICLDREVPPNAAGYKGKLLLGYLLKNDTSGSEHLFREFMIYWPSKSYK